jgi:hypothetical protein
MKLEKGRGGFSSRGDTSNLKGWLTFSGLPVDRWVLLPTTCGGMTASNFVGLTSYESGVARVTSSAMSSKLSWLFRTRNENLSQSKSSFPMIMIGKIGEIGGPCGILGPSTHHFAKQPHKPLTLMNGGLRSFCEYGAMDVMHLCCASYLRC